MEPAESLGFSARASPAEKVVLYATEDDNISKVISLLKDEKSVSYPSYGPLVDTSTIPEDYPLNSIKIIMDVKTIDENEIQVNKKIKAHYQDGTVKEFDVPENEKVELSRYYGTPTDNSDPNENSDSNLNPYFFGLPIAAIAIIAIILAYRRTRK